MNQLHGPLAVVSNSIQTYDLSRNSFKDNLTMMNNYHDLRYLYAWHASSSETWSNATITNTTC
jgi:hypothetical protein